MEEIKLTDLMSKKQLQHIQDSFSKMTGLAALTTDVDGNPITEGSNFTRYCMNYTRESKVGCERCQKCDIMGAEVTLKTGKSATYVCHSGLIDFAAPIMIGDQLVGSFIGGQALYEHPNKENIRRIAAELDIDFDEYWEALMEVPIIDKAQIECAAEFLYEVANTLSEMAYGKYLAIESQKETERVANMKTDFLANMSHEIRTPMNAVIGMAEMALREELSPAARNYISQIKSSGNALLNIINDILDFSKIESGKMDIIEEEFEPLSLINDVSSVLMTRLRDKDVELIGTENPTLPRGLLGDALRIRQIIINIANNAIKFTEHGVVWIDVDYEKISDDEIKVKIAVADTGIGIKKEDLGKLFNSFQQVDSKRNRNVEGTGLGLAITARLLSLMNGTIKVSSVYGEGSVFSMEIPLKVTDWTHSLEIIDHDKKTVIGYWRNISGASHFYDELKRMDVDSYALVTLDRMDKLLEMYREPLKDKQLYLFTSDANYREEMQDFVDKYPDVQFIVVCDFFRQLKEDQKPNVRFIRKPFSTVGIVLALNDEDAMARDENIFEFDFIAPDAKVMIVDDNDVNLMVAEGLLEPLQMQITLANSGKKALKYLEAEKYDIVFMDHMMPEMDGVETTHIIRRLHPEFDDMPVIALTANAVGEAKKMFLEEGMNDFVAKPIEIKNIITKIRQWLPKNKILKGNAASAALEARKNEPAASDGMPRDKNGALVIGDLDTTTAIAMIGNEKLYFAIMEKYYKTIKSKIETIKSSEVAEDITTYTIEVHALKSSSKQIGAMELSDMAAELEACGNAKDIATIHAKTDALLDRYRGYIEVFMPLFDKGEEQTAKKPTAPADILNALFDEMMVAVDDLDMDGMEAVAAKMDEYSYEGVEAELFESLKEAVSNIDVDICEEIINEWRAL